MAGDSERLSARVEAVADLIGPAPEPAVPDAAPRPSPDGRGRGTR